MIILYRGRAARKRLPTARDRWRIEDRVRERVAIRGRDAASDPWARDAEGKSSVANQRDQTPLSYSGMRIERRSRCTRALSLSRRSRPENAITSKEERKLIILHDYCPPRGDPVY